jgi:hypothetical protein
MYHIFDQIVPIVGILTTFGVPAAVIIVIAVLRYRQKMMLITRGCGPVIDYPAVCGQTPLLWGMILTSVSAVALGTGIVRTDTDFTTMGILGLAGGLALLAYWFLTSPQRKRETELYERNYGANGVICPIITSGASLLWGMVFTAVSVTGIIISLVRYEYDWTNVAFLTLTAGVAMLAHWFVTGPQRKRAFTLFEQKCGQIQ